MTHAPNLTNTVYAFLVETVEASSSDDALYGAETQETEAEKVTKKTVRVGSSTSEPEIGGDGRAKESNGRLAVEFIVRPETQSVRDRLEAREAAHQMAMQFITEVGANKHLRGRRCDAVVTNKEDGYRNIGGTKHQVSVIGLIVEPY